MSILMERVLLIIAGMALGKALQMWQDWKYYKRAMNQLRMEQEEQQMPVEDFIKILQELTKEEQQDEE